MKYRTEIDGLRALAVMPVILFHAGFESFSGGFVGVDVFFVISGYLITTIIISEMTEGKFSIINFYERRARRILPALFFVMAICLPFAWFWLTPSALNNFGQSLVAVSIFSSNILFWFESGYFDTAAELKPLLHTWSLAVEEQYYILFPIFLMLIWKLGIKSVSVLLSVVFLISLSVAVWATQYTTNPRIVSGAFFLLPTRGWELLIGAFTAFFLQYSTHLKSHTANQVLSLLGLGMIFYSIFSFDETTPFPSLYALIPTIGTGLLILCTVPKTLVHKLLSLKFIVLIGLISYSAYLWHQPLFAFARHRIIGELSDVQIIILCLSSLLLAYFSWRYVEAPFRNKAIFTKNRIFLFSVMGILIFSIIGMFFQLNIILKSSPNVLKNIPFTSLSEKMEVVGEVCFDNELMEQGDFRYCIIGDKQAERSILLFGDSHIQAIQYSLDKKLRKEKIRGIYLKNIKYCDTTIFTTNRRNKNEKSVLNCPNSFSAALDYFSDADYLVLLSRWSMKYFYPKSDLGTPHFTNKAFGCSEIDLGYRSYLPLGENGFREPTKNNMAEALNNLLEVATSKFTTLVVYPVPEVGCDPYKYNLIHKKQTGSQLVSLSFPVEEYDKRNKFVINIFDEFFKKNQKSFIPVRLRPLFCERKGQKFCVVIEDSIPLYYDDDHLSYTGANIVTDEIINSLNY